MQIENQGKVLVLNLGDNPTKEEINNFQNILNVGADMTNNEISGIAKINNVSESCAADIYYLRTRSRWSKALEEELITLHKAGTPPNMNEFGSTKETQEALLKEAIGILTKPELPKLLVTDDGLLGSMNIQRGIADLLP